jgi:hypothetical protein
MATPAQPTSTLISTTLLPILISLANLSPEPAAPEGAPRSERKKSKKRLMSAA